MNKGSYLLVLYLDSDVEIEVGSLGKQKFEKGYYIYIGSAMNSLTERVKRHLSKNKRYHWHIDYLLNHAKIISVFLIPSDEKIECKIARKLGGEITVEKFGSTDCKCKSHLFYYKRYEDLLKDIPRILRNHHEGV